jgi:hypothetical protein
MADVATWTVIDEQRVVQVESDSHDLTLDPRALGWEPKPEGLCRGDVCVPWPRDVNPDALDAATIARLVGRPVVVDRDERVVSFAAPAAERADALRSGLAPDFELPDVHGVPHRLSDHRGRKVVLYAYASW